MSRGQLLAAAWIVPNAVDVPLENGAIRIVGSRVVDVGPCLRLRREFPEEPLLDFGRAAIAPGFVNAHTHTYSVLTRGMSLPASEGGDFGDFLASVWWPHVEDQLTVEMLTAAARMASAQSLLSGVTTLYDIVEAPKTVPDVLPVLGDAATSTGIRVALSVEATERVSALNGLAGLGENTAFIEEVASSSRERTSGLMCWHTSYSCSGQFIRKAVAAAKELGVACHFHCNEGSYEPTRSQADHGCTTLEYYASLGVTAADLIASQCVVMADEELEILAECGASVTHMPLSNGLYGAGIAPVPGMLERGITIGLGSDGATDDFFEVVRAASIVHRARLMDSRLISAATAFDMATRGGASALGLDDVGVIAEGCNADLQVIRLDLPTPTTSSNLLDQLVFWRSAADVTDVMVDGEWCVRAGKLLRVDIEEARADTACHAASLWSRRSST